MTDTPKFVHSPTHLLPTLEQLRAVHPFYVGKIVKGRNSDKIAQEIADGRKTKSKKK